MNYDDLNIVMIIGQIVGAMAIVFGFLSFQMNSAKKILTMQLVVTVLFSIHYLLIGALSGFALNLVGIVRNIVYYNLNSKNKSSKVIPIFFAAVMAIAGFISWQGFFSLFMIAGLVINSVCMSFSNSKNIKRSILVSSPMVIVYNVAFFSIGGIIYESVVIASSIVGLVKEKN